MLLNLFLNTVLAITLAEPIKVAIIDSGYNPKAGLPLCKNGHYDYIENKDFVEHDGINEHGTHIASTIYQNAKRINLCFIFLRVWKNEAKNVDINQAFLRAALFKAHVINYSMSGSNYIELERDAMQVVSSLSIPIFNSSGNDRQVLFKRCNQYPACYKNIPLLFPIQNKDKTASKKDFVSFPFCSSAKAKDKIRWSCGTSISAAYATAFYLRTVYAKIQHD